MTVQVGTHDISTLLAARFTSANAFGMDNIAAIIAADLAAHNAVVTEMITDMAEPTTEVQSIYGSGTGGEMVKVDEYGASSTQRSQPGSTVGFPLNKFQYPVGWTRDYAEQAKAADYAIRTNAAKKAHLVAIRREIKLALFTPTNTTFSDYLTNGIAVPVKALVNGDGAAIPDGPDGGSFDAATHTHYNANATLTAAALTATITDVIEHGHGGRIIAAVHFNDVAAVIALTGFVAAPDYRVIAANTGAVTRQTTNPANQYNRYLGVFGAAEVWVKPWAVQNYIFVWDAADAGKPLKFRQLDLASPLQGLRVMAEYDSHPLYAQFIEAKFGLGVWTRTNGAVLYFAGGAYVAPSL